MTGQTAQGQFPFAQGGDPVQGWPGTSEALADRLEAVMFTAAKPASALPPEYPIGSSIMRLITADAVSGGWPRGVSGVVQTIRRQSGDAAYQVWFRTSASIPEMWHRAWSPGTTDWGQWIVIGSVRTAKSMHCGEYTFPSSSGNQSRTITFPAGRFESRPWVTVTGSTRDAIMTATAVSASGFTANSGPESGASSLARRVTWIAVEMNDLAQ